MTRKQTAVVSICLTILLGGCGDITAVEVNGKGDARASGGTTGQAGSPDAGIDGIRAVANDAHGSEAAGGAGSATGDAGRADSQTGDGAVSVAIDAISNPVVDGGVATNIDPRCGDLGAKDYIACCRVGDDCNARFGKRDAWCDCSMTPPGTRYTTCEYFAGGVMPPTAEFPTFPTHCVFTR